MDPRRLVQILQRRWMTFVATLLVVVALASAFTIRAPRYYESTMQFFVSTTGADSNAQLYQGGTFTQQRVKSYAQLVNSPTFLRNTLPSLETGATAPKVSASVPLDTVLINVSVVDRSADRATATAKALGQALPKRITELEKVGDAPSSPVKVTLVEAPTTPKAPVSPKPFMNFAAGLVLGAALGLLLALLREHFDQRVRSEADLAAAGDAPLLGQVPARVAGAKGALLQNDHGQDARSEAYRSIRTNLQFVCVSGRPKTLVVTSSVPGEGKSTTVLNLARTLAASGLRVVAIDADLRRPRLHHYAELDGAVGLTDVLIGQVAFDDVVERLPGEGERRAYVLSAGRIPPNPSELVGSSAMTDLLTQLQGEFDVVLLDSPPVLPVTDAVVLGLRSDGVILVVAHGQVDRGQVSHAADKIRAGNATLLGLVLNAVPRSANAYGTYDYRPEPESRSSLRRAARRS